ncbi:hypothetical protein P872_09545 [Rhodonellum psychrophilum GCM71 = DSM 17998]|uniref:Uncharacterized protein n=1 Tax=Rhodonellum psychrophilum GCM71 = DSM 17998 TaxID=1123057 RepID=U5BV05_9BACT|nr:hypothetical protein P872_09545 [Rhodonellum psychrophilum GCM71 = DSM 17998]
MEAYPLDQSQLNIPLGIYRAAGRLLAFKILVRKSNSRIHLDFY